MVDRNFAPGNARRASGNRALKACLTQIRYWRWPLIHLISYISRHECFWAVEVNSEYLLLEAVATRVKFSAAYSLF
jgi:hypothetical protein